MKFNYLIEKVVFFLALTLCSTSYAQTNEWQLLKTENGIEVYSKIVSCETEGFTIPLETLVFKAINTTSSKKSISLEFEIHFEEGCNGCQGSDETSSHFELKSGESKESNCSNINELNSFVVKNQNFKGSWNYTHSLVKIQTTN